MAWASRVIQSIIHFTPGETEAEQVRGICKVILCVGAELRPNPGQALSALESDHRPSRAHVQALPG